MVNLVDIGAAPTVLNKIKDADKPVVFFNRELATDTVKSYDKAMFVEQMHKKAGVLQGKILVESMEG